MDVDSDATLLFMARHEINSVDVRTRLPLGRLRRGEHVIVAACSSPTGAFVATKDTVFHLWLTSQMDLIWRSASTSPNEELWKIAFNPVIQRLLVVTVIGDLQVFDITIGSVARAKWLGTHLRQNIGHNAAIADIVFSPCGITFATASPVLRAVTIRDSKNFATILTFTRDLQQDPTCCCYGPGASLAVGYSNGDVCIWNLRSGYLERTIAAHAKAICSVVLSSRGLYTSSQDGTVVGHDEHFEFECKYRSSLPGSADPSKLVLVDTSLFYFVAKQGIFCSDILSKQDYGLILKSKSPQAFGFCVVMKPSVEERFQSKLTMPQVA